MINQELKHLSNNFKVVLCLTQFPNINSHLQRMAATVENTEK